MQALKSALKIESENVVHHLCIQDSAAFWQPSGRKLPYKLQRLCLRLTKTRKEKSLEPRRTKACYKTREIILL